jgi:hypothetical protein
MLECPLADCRSYKTIRESAMDLACLASGMGYKKLVFSSLGCCSFLLIVRYWPIAARREGPKSAKSSRWHVGG